MINEIKQSLNFYLAHLSPIDFGVYIWMAFTFLFLIVFCVYIAFKSPSVGLLLFVFSLVALGFGVYFAPKFLDERLRARQLELVSQKQLEYSNTLLLELALTNLSKKPFKYCKIELKFYKYSSNSLKNYANTLKPFLRNSIVINDAIEVNQTHAITHAVNDFRHNDYNITLNSECF